MGEWTREFKQRLNPQVDVIYDITSEAFDEGWEDPLRDDDASSILPTDRARQKVLARPQLLPGHTSLVKEPSRDEVKKGLVLQAAPQPRSG